MSQDSLTARRKKRGPHANERKASQRERLLAGMVSAANRDGYAGGNVSAVIHEAGVSRPTFYDYFEDREDCFAATVIDCHSGLLETIVDAVHSAPPEDALSAAADGIFTFTSAHPAQARFLMSEALAGGSRALDARDSGIAEAACVVESALNQAAAHAMVPDLPVAPVLGAIYRMLASRIRRGERALTTLADDLAAWLQSYAQPAGDERHRRGLEPHTILPTAARRQSLTLAASPVPSRGRPGLSRQEVVESHRRQIICAAAETVWKRGYHEATISEITRLAGVDSRAFYRLFADKQSVVSTVHELGFQYLLSATGSAFFNGRNWPARVWNALVTATETIDHNPSFAYLAFVEAHAVGSRGVQRVEDGRRAFAMFFEEGRRHHADHLRFPQTGPEAIVATAFEIIYQHVRTSRSPQTSRLIGHLAHVSLTPFIGAEASAELIRQRLTPAHRLRRPAHVYHALRSGSDVPSRTRSPA